MPVIPFEKYQGLGNDFILLDGERSVALPELTGRFIRSVCDRRYGVGADGLLLFERAKPPETVRMTYFNADGARAETCFNGLRCIALHAARTGIAARGEPFTIASDAGPVRAEVDPKRDFAWTEMPGPVFAPEEVPVLAPAPVVDQSLSFPAGELKGTALSIGNPHFVVFTESQADLDEMNRFILKVGHEVEHSPHFPARTNFEYARVIDEATIHMAVWERGVGQTLACGSGATAALCAAVKTGRAAAGIPVKLVMAGGELEIQTDAGLRSALVKGPAAHVFSGHLPTDLSTK